MDEIFYANNYSSDRFKFEDDKQTISETFRCRQLKLVDPILLFKEP